MPRRYLFELAIAFAVASFAFAPSGAHAQAHAYNVSAPAVSNNLAVYFVRGTSDARSAPVTLADAVSRGWVTIHEGKEQRLMLDNASDHDVLVQYGDIFQGGLQDRVAGTTLIIPPRKWNVPIDVFCVEKGRSVARAGESANTFSVADTPLPSAQAKFSVLSGTLGPEDEYRVRQDGVWESTERLRNRLSQVLGVTVSSTLSETSLPLALQNDAVLRARQPYFDALERKADKRNVVGVVVAINGKLQSADLYASHALFREEWPRLLRGYAVAALASTTATKGALPSKVAVRRFLRSAKQARVVDSNFERLTLLHRRESDAVIATEAQRPDGSFVQRTYLATARLMKPVPRAANAAVDAVESGSYTQAALNHLQSAYRDQVGFTTRTVEVVVPVLGGLLAFVAMSLWRDRRSRRAQMPVPVTAKVFSAPLPVLASDSNAGVPVHLLREGVRSEDGENADERVRDFREAA
jgi:hypothetical protein